MYNCISSISQLSGKPADRDHIIGMKSWLSSSRYANRSDYQRISRSAENSLIELRRYSQDINLDINSLFLNRISASWWLTMVDIGREIETEVFSS